MIKMLNRLFLWRILIMHNHLTFNQIYKNNFPSPTFNDQKYIYVLEFKKNHELASVITKVGITQNPFNRINDLKRSMLENHNYYLEKIYVSNTTYNDPKTIEQTIHGNLDQYHSHKLSYSTADSDGESEFFDLSASKILALIDKMDLNIVPAVKQLSSNNTLNNNKPALLPIKSNKLMEQIREILLEGNYGRRNLFMFDLGLATGLTPNSLMSLQIRDLKNPNDLIISNQADIDYQDNLSNEILNELNNYLTWIYHEYDDVTENSYIFPSNKSNTVTHIKQHGFYQVMQKIQKKIQTDKNITNIVKLGTLTPRKTYGYRLYQKTKDINIVKKVFNQDSIIKTKKYIGLI